MDPQREHIQADLRGLLAGEVHCDDFFTQMYASDASLYEIRPLAVVRPASVDDVVACVRYAADHGHPLHPRGAGTGLAGESLGPGIVLDFSHSMRRILSVSDSTVTVQPGAVHGQLNRLLAREGRMFGPDPATGGVTTMGSVLAVDGGGSRWLAHGSARRHVVSLQVVTATGDVITAEPTRVVEPTTDDVRGNLVRRVADLIEREQTAIATHQPKSWVNRCGYQLQDLMSAGKLHLEKLLVGSEGTLGIITQATVQTVPLAKAITQVLFFFDRLEPAAAAANDAANHRVAACDLMDRRILTLAREVDERYGRVIPREAEAMLLVEFQGDDLATARDAAQQLILAWRWKSRWAFDALAVFEADDIDLFRRLARRVVPTLSRIKGDTRPLPFVEDIAVPPARLGEFFTRLQNVLKRHEITASLFGHVGHGQLHVRPLLDPRNAEHVRLMQEFATDLYEEVLAVEGTISGEHASGLSRTWFLKRQYGPLYDVFREVKRIFDPRNILNPGKVVADVPQPLTKNLRAVSPVAVPADNDQGPISIVPLHLDWSQRTFVQETEACNGCGRCRTQSPDYRMCPTFRQSPAEEATPRSKASILRGVLSGNIAAAELTTEAAKQIADLCVNCHQCQRECPAEVDIPKLVVETKAQYVGSNGLKLPEWFLSRLDWLASWGSTSATLTNWLLGNRAARWLLERFFGLARTRKLPRVAARSFLRWAQRRRLTRMTSSGKRKVAYFIDVYANRFDTELAEALITVLQHNGVSVYVPPRQLPSEMARITMGDVERARRAVQANVKQLAEAVRQGYEIITSEPSAAVCLKHEYVHLLGDDDARLVASHTHEATSYLWRLHREGQLALNFKPLNLSVGYHLPCHVRAITSEVPGANLLELIPALQLKRLEKGCSGMAGTFGLQANHFRQSIRMGFGLIAALRDSRIEIGATECSACKMQMEQGTTKPTLHPVKILAYAYGLMPRIAERFHAESEELLVT